MEKNSKIYVSGAGGLVGSAVVRELYRQGYTDVTRTTRTTLAHNGYSIWKIYKENELLLYILKSFL